MEDIKHECGIAAVFIKEKSRERDNGLYYLYKLLLNLQNRGQLSAGVSTYNKNRAQLIDTYKGRGSVNDVFKTNDQERSFKIFRRYRGNKGIGHVRYATSGSDTDIHPFERHHGRIWKWFAFAFNGNLVNLPQLTKRLLEKKDYHIISNSDNEVIMHYLSREFMGNKKPDLVKVFSNLSKKFDGAYNIVFLNAHGDMIIMRDPYGFRPLVYGNKNGIFLAASESNALINCGASNIKSLDPGSMILIQNEKIQIKKFIPSPKKAFCMFEWVYFANVSSVLNGKSVYITRTNLGKELARIEKEKIDHNCIVVPVPDSAKPVADAFAFELKIPSQEGLIRNRYVGRTFIESGDRENKVKNKFTALREILKGKKVFLVDDSIVRGTTLKQLVRLVKKIGGAKEVHVRVSCPPIIGPCYYGIDMSTINELALPRYQKNLFKEGISEKTFEKMAIDVGADSIKYQTIEGLVKSIGLPKNDLCLACLNSKYPTPEGKKLFRRSLNNFHKGVKEDRRNYEC